MVKGFSDNEVENNTQNTQIKEKKGLAGFLKGKKFTYTLPGKKQIFFDFPCIAQLYASDAGYKPTL